MRRLVIYVNMEFNKINLNNLVFKKIGVVHLALLAQFGNLHYLIQLSQHLSRIDRRGLQRLAHHER